MSNLFAIGLGVLAMALALGVITLATDWRDRRRAKKAKQDADRSPSFAGLKVKGIAPVVDADRPPPIDLLKEQGWAPGWASSDTINRALDAKRAAEHRDIYGTWVVRFELPQGYLLARDDKVSKLAQALGLNLYAIEVSHYPGTAGVVEVMVNGSATSDKDQALDQLSTALDEVSYTGDVVMEGVRLVR